jgi:hypothetical protein
MKHATFFCFISLLLLPPDALASDANCRMNSAICVSTTCSDCIKDAGNTLIVFYLNLGCTWCKLANSTLSACIPGTITGENNHGLCSDYYWMQCASISFFLRSNRKFRVSFLKHATPTLLSSL